MGINHFYTDIIKCVRCKGNHTHIIFQAIDNPADDYTWWATCPATNQPILAKRLNHID